MQSLGTRILEGLNTSLIGMTITISSLILLSIIITLMSRVIIAMAAKKTAGGVGNQQHGSGATKQGGADGIRQESPMAHMPDADGFTGCAIGDVICGALDIAPGGGLSGTSEGRFNATPGGGFNVAPEGGLSGELIAVLTAAISQFTGDAAGSFRVVSYKRTGRSSPIWNLRGRDEYLSGKDAVQSQRT